MEETKDYSERREHERFNVESLVIGILTSGEPELIGSVIDISLGGVKFTYNEHRMASTEKPCRSIDLIADDCYIEDIPCKNIWEDNLETYSFSKLTDLKQCGIQFENLTPNQIFLLRSFVNRCTSSGANEVNPNVYATSTQ